MKNKSLAGFLITLSFSFFPLCYADFFPFVSQSDPKAMEVVAKKKSEKLKLIMIQAMM